MFLKNLFYNPLITVKDPLFFSHGSTNSCGVAIGFCGLKSLHIIDKKSDEIGRILIIDAKVNDEKFLLVNIYNSNTESEQIKTLDNLKNLLEVIDNISDKKNNSWWRFKFGIGLQCRSMRW